MICLLYIRRTFVRDILKFGLYDFQFSTLQESLPFWGGSWSIRLGWSRLGVLCWLGVGGGGQANDWEY